MWSLFFILLPPLIAWLILRRYFPTIGSIGIMGLSVFVSFLLLSWPTLLWSNVLNATTTTKILLCLLCCALGWMWRMKVGNAMERGMGLGMGLAKPIAVLVALKNTWYLWLSFGLVSLVFSYLLVTHNVQVKNGNWFSGGSTWGDVALHLTYINYFARQETLSLTSPIFSQVTTTYPFLFDWYTSILYRLGSSIQLALIVTQGQAFLALLLLAWALVRTLRNRRLTVCLTMLLFFAGGGWGWWYFWGDWQTSGISLLHFLQHQPVQYANTIERSIFFSNVVTDMLLPQRGFSVGLGGVMATIILLVEFLKHGKARCIVLAGAIVGLLPLFHFHSFLWLSGAWFCEMLHDCWQQPKHRRSWFFATAIVVLLALPQIWWYVANGIGSQFLSWHPGWMLHDDLNHSFISFSKLSLLNFGLTAGVLLLLPSQLKKLYSKNAAVALLFGYSWLVFVVCLLFSFQPWPYDNLKFMMISYFFFCIFTAMQLSTSLHGVRAAFVILIVIASTLSGCLSITRELFISSEIASAQDVTMARELQKVLIPGAVTLTADNHNHPVPMLVGQPIVSGYPGWLWSQGLDASATRRDIAEIYEGKPEAASLLKKYNVGYVFIGKREQEAWAVKDLFWSHNYPLIYQKNGTLVYEVIPEQN